MENGCGSLNWNWPAKCPFLSYVRWCVYIRLMCRTEYANLIESVRFVCSLCFFFFSRAQNNEPRESKLNKAKNKRRVTFFISLSHFIYSIINIVASYFYHIFSTDEHFAFPIKCNLRFRNFTVFISSAFLHSPIGDRSILFFESHLL